MSSRIEIAKEYYSAFAKGDRRFIEEHLADNFTFSAPPDPHLDRAGYFERCWPGAGKGGALEFDSSRPAMKSSSHMRQKSQMAARA